MSLFTTIFLWFSFCQGSHDNLLSKSSIGELNIGSPIEDVYVVYGKENTNLTRCAN